MLTVIMPMAGLGARFADAGETQPKPLISVAGVPMFRLALDAVRMERPEASVVFVILAEHEKRFGLSKMLLTAAPSSQIAIVPKLTGGSLETCLSAEPYTAPDDLVVVLDCDLTFSASGYFAQLSSIEADGQKLGGMLLSFRSREPRYSYAEVVCGRVVRTVEKQPISDHALIGAYGFGSGRIFFAAAHQIVERNLRTGNGEFYVSSVYNNLIANGFLVRLAEAERYWSMGTPEELRACLTDRAFLAHAKALLGGRQVMANPNIS